MSEKRVKVGFVARSLPGARIGVVSDVESFVSGLVIFHMIDFRGKQFHVGSDRIEIVADNIDDYLNNVLAKELGLV